jgi:hypothetical protein
MRFNAANPHIVGNREACPETTHLLLWERVLVSYPTSLSAERRELLKNV